MTSQTAVTVKEVVRAWGRILQGRRPNISIEITRECPLRCPGCYAYGDEHLGGGVTLVALYAVLAPRHAFMHYLLFLVLPVTWWGGAAFGELRQSLPAPRVQVALGLGFVPELHQERRCDSVAFLYVGRGLG